MPLILSRFLKLFLLAFSLLVTLVCFTACNNQKDSTDADDGVTFSVPLTDASTEYGSDTPVVTEGADSEYDAYIILADDKTTISGDGVTFENGILTVSQGGLYRITGTLTDGKIYVNSSDEAKKVKLLLSGVNISCSYDAPLYIENSPDETVLILEDGSYNSFSDTSREIPTDTTDYATAAIYSKDDLQIEGNGSLTVNGNFGKGIFSKNDIDIHGGIITVTAADDGIRGKDSVEITDGIISIVSAGDGIRTSETSESDKGRIDISGGTVSIESQLDGIQAVSDISITSGSVTVKSGGGSTGSISDSYDSFNRFGGGGFPAGGMYSEDEEDTASAKGIKADETVTVSGGIINVDSSDDSIHAPDVTVSGGELNLRSDDDGIHADELVTVTGGLIAVAYSYEGIEGRNIGIYAGTLIINSSDDGFNAASSDSSSSADYMSGFSLLSFRGNPGGMMDYDSSCNISMSNGTVIINAQGDGVDSNGSVTMTGGRMIVYGPTNSGNGALDYGGSFNISGGTLLAVGSAGMAQSVTGNGVGVLDFRTDGEGDTVYAIADADSNCLIAFTSVKRFESVVFASDRLSSDGSYGFYQGGKVSGYTDKIYGICFDGVYSAGSLAATLS